MKQPLKQRAKFDNMRLKHLKSWFLTRRKTKRCNLMIDICGYRCQTRKRLRASRKNEVFEPPTLTDHRFSNLVKSQKRIGVSDAREAAKIDAFWSFLGSPANNKLAGEARASLACKYLRSLIPTNIVKKERQKRGMSCLGWARSAMDLTPNVGTSSNSDPPLVYSGILVSWINLVDDLKWKTCNLKNRVARHAKWK